MGKGKKKKRGGLTADFLKEDVLQGVVLADSFSYTFRPVSLQTAKVLFPLVNVPMIDYTLEFLAAGGVKQVFVVCTAHAQAVEAYLSTSSWAQRQANGFKIQTILSEECYSAGDALRHLDSLNLVQNDFVLISGDVLSNIKLKPIVDAHKARFKQDKRNIMTMLMKHAPPAHRTRSLMDDTVVAINKKTKQLLLYHNDIGKSSVNMDVALFEEHPTLQLRYDLMDCSIDICSPEVLSLFNDNFDYQDVRNDFVMGILGSEILGNKLYVHEVSGEYAARVVDLHTYHSVSRDIIQRWTYPMVPDNNMFGHTSYKYYRGNRYKEEDNNDRKLDATLARSAVFGSHTVIGGGTVIGANSVVQGSVLGRGCRIGANVTIRNSYLWDYCVVEDNVVIDNSLCAKFVTLQRGAHISPGCILSFNVVIGKDKTVPKYTRVTTEAKGGGDFEDNDPEEPELMFKADEDMDLGGGDKRANVVDESVVGVGGHGRSYSLDSDQTEELEEKVPSGLHDYHLNSLFPEPDLKHVIVSNQEDSDADDFFDEVDREESDQDAISTSATDAIDAPSDRTPFFSELHDTFARGYYQALPLEAIKLEVASCKLSHNATMVEYGQAVTHTMLRISADEAKAEYTEDGVLKFTRTVLLQLKKVFKAWHELLSKFSGREVEQVQLLSGLADACCLNRGALVPAFPHALKVMFLLSPSQRGAHTVCLVLQELYELDVFSEEAVLEWYKQASSSPSPSAHGTAELSAADKQQRKELLEKAKPFVEWLQDAEEDSSSGSGSGSGSDSDD